MVKFRKDMQDSKSFINLRIDKVGIIGVNKKVEIIQENKKYSFYPKISALISLPQNQRGIHMSRSSETIEEVINESVFKPASTIEIVADRIARKLFERHPYTSNIEVKLEGSIIVQLREIEYRNIQKTYDVSSLVYGKKNELGQIDYEYFIGVKALGMTCCPCALNLSKQYAEDILKTRKDIKISDENITKILNLLPFASHNQRSEGTIIVQIKDLNKQEIDILDVIDVIEESMSGRIQSILKRPDEGELVRSAHLKPLFAEDVVREMGKNFIARNFPILDDTDIIFKVETFESIHPYNVYCELKMKYAELKNKMI
ncbi:hypothetical protein LCGC14_0583060 [marine sediment metagenome]|uniref:GTP cyclohydrolase IV n=1 Tax=marine sediment metagenome TaxID=412755 RepID=A0A0F9RKT8_9ZZZZ